jgi:hypothetical protein
MQLEFNQHVHLLSFFFRSFHCDQGFGLVVIEIWSTYAPFIFLRQYLTTRGLGLVVTKNLNLKGDD